MWIYVCVFVCVYVCVCVCVNGWVCVRQAGQLHHQQTNLFMDPQIIYKKELAVLSYSVLPLLLSCQLEEGVGSEGKEREEGKEGNGGEKEGEFISGSEIQLLRPEKGGYGGLIGI